MGSWLGWDKIGSGKGVFGDFDTVGMMIAMAVLHDGDDEHLGLLIGLVVLLWVCCMYCTCVWVASLGTEMNDGQDGWDEVWGQQKHHVDCTVKWYYLRSIWTAGALLFGPFQVLTWLYLYSGDTGRSTYDDWWGPVLWSLLLSALPLPWWCLLTFHVLMFELLRWRQQMHHHFLPGWIVDFPFSFSPQISKWPFLLFPFDSFKISLCSNW